MARATARHKEIPHPLISAGNVQRHRHRRSGFPRTAHGADRAAIEGRARRTRAAAGRRRRGTSTAARRGCPSRTSVSGASRLTVPSMPSSESASITLSNDWMSSSAATSTSPPRPISRSPGCVGRRARAARLRPRSPGVAGAAFPEDRGRDPAVFAQHCPTTFRFTTSSGCCSRRACCCTPRSTDARSLFLLDHALLCLHPMIETGRAAAVVEQRERPPIPHGRVTRRLLSPPGAPRHWPAAATRGRVRKALGDDRRGSGTRGHDHL